MSKTLNVVFFFFPAAFSGYAVEVGHFLLGDESSICMGFGIYQLVLNAAKFSNTMLFHYREKEEDQMLADMIQRLGKGPFSPYRAALGLTGGLNLLCVCSLSCRWIS